MQTVKRITREDSKPFIIGIHYAHRMPSSTPYVFGLFEEDSLVDVVSFGYPGTPQIRKSVLGDAKDILLLELNRLVVVTPSKNSASRLVGGALKLLPSPMLVVSYADGGQGHVGYVYQATNFYFAGATRSADNEYIIDGIKVHPRVLAHRGIKNIGAWAKEQGYPAVKPELKNRYLYIIGNKKEKKDLENHIKWSLSKNYPKGTSSKYDAPNQGLF